MHESEKWKWSRSVVSDSSPPHGLQPTRLLRPWDFPGKSTGVGCHCLLRQWDTQVPKYSNNLVPVKISVQLCLTLCNPVDCSPSGSSVYGILQARILEWVAIPFSRGSSWPRDQIWVSHIPGSFFTVWATRESPELLLLKYLFNIYSEKEYPSIKTWGKFFYCILSSSVWARELYTLTIHKVKRWNQPDPVSLKSGLETTAQVCPWGFQAMTSDFNHILFVRRVFVNTIFSISLFSTATVLTTMAAPAVAAWTAPLLAHPSTQLCWEEQVTVQLSCRSPSHLCPLNPVPLFSFP